MWSFPLEFRTFPIQFSGRYSLFVLFGILSQASSSILLTLFPLPDALRTYAFIAHIPAAVVSVALVFISSFSRRPFFNTKRTGWDCSLLSPFHYLELGPRDGSNFLFPLLVYW